MIWILAGIGMHKSIEIKRWNIVILDLKSQNSSVFKLRALINNQIWQDCKTILEFESK